MNYKTISLIIASLLILNACSDYTHSQYKKPEVNIPADWLTALPKSVNGPFKWQDFHDPALTKWLSEVVERNNDLSIAALRVYRAKLNYDQSVINSKPDVTLNISSSQNRNIKISSPWKRSSSSSLNVQYEVDLWGKVASQREAARWSHLATAEDLMAARLSLIAEASKNYWQIGFLNQRLQLSLESILYAEDTVRQARARYEAGSVGEMDVIEAKLSLINQRNNYQALLQQRLQSLTAHAVLVGQPGGDPIVEPLKLPDGPLPKISGNLPTMVLLRRPDIRASEMRLREQLADNDQKRLAFLPAFNLTSGLGGSSSSLIEFISNPIASLGAGLTFPFIQYHNMNNQIEISEVEYKEKSHAYQQLIYKTLASIENVLSSYESLAKQESELRSALTLATQSERLNQIRYNEGDVPINYWLDAQEKRRVAEIALYSIRYERLQNLAQIYLEFGGTPDSP